MQVKIKKLNPEAQLPKYATPGSAGFDFAALQVTYIHAGETALVKTGLSMEIPVGYELQIRPRSGTSLKTGLRVANAPGTVDSDYRGEICLIMTNTGTEAIWIGKGERIAQGVIAPVIQAQFELVESLSETERGAGGFGSTGRQ